MRTGGGEGTGARIAQYRKLRGLTQRGLALRANVAYGTLTKVESGHAAPQPVLVSAVARALGVDVGRLTGHAFDTEGPSPLVDDLLEPLRLALDAYDLGPDETVASRPLADVEAEVFARTRELMADGLVAGVAAAVPALLDELGGLAAAGTARDARSGGAAGGAGVADAAAVGEAGGAADARVWRAMAHAYRCAHHVASRWGYRDLAMIALDRMGRAAERGHEPLLEALRDHERAHEHLRAGQHHRAHVLLDRAERLAALAPAGPGKAALAGTGHLAASFHAARDGDGRVADEHLAEAAALAADVGEVDDAFWLSFGPTNVALHRVSALVVQERHGEAVEAARGLRLPQRWHATRLGYHHMDLGRAHAALGDHDRALRSLVEARRIAPQQTRTHPATRAAVVYLLSSRRNVSEGLARYARWVGV